MRIPEISLCLTEIANDARIPQDLSARIADCASSMKRRVFANRSGAQSATVTPQVYEAIRAYHTANLNLTQAAIARHFNVNQGRVSEALRGKRS